MSKPERLEDLGRVRAMLEMLVEDEGWELFGHHRMKDAYGIFSKLDEEKQCDIFDHLLSFRESARDRLWTICSIAKGDEDE